MEFKDISNEFHRTYTFFKEGQLVKITIDLPMKVNVSESGGHRVLDSQGVSHYIPSGWIHLEWKVVKDTEPFSF